MKSNPAPDLWTKVLVPTDFSEASEPAVQLAADLAERRGVEVVLLHVAPPAYEGLRIHTEEMHARMRHEAAEALRTLAADFFKGDTKPRRVVKEGRPAEVICATAAEEKVDVILIPTHGHSGLKHVLLGSVAEKVVRHAPCGVLVVR